MKFLQPQILTAFALAGAIVASCDAGEPEPTTSPRTIGFEGERVHAALAEQPDRSIILDLREGQRYGFDQRDRTIDFSRFRVRDSAAQPVPMLEFAETIELETDAPMFTLETVAADDVQFRVGADCELMCEDIDVPCGSVCCIMWCDGHDPKRDDWWEMW